jgi:3-phosphoshikimate 1-carboxyvinyltransferase
MKPLVGETRVPGDKSIAHRACLVAALAEGESRVEGFSGGGDNHSTLKVLRALGVEVRFDTPTTLLLRGVGLRGLRASGAPLDCGNSGTTLRLLMGVLAGQSGHFTLVGDASLSARPVARVAGPLARLGARIETPEGDHPPVWVHGGPLRGAELDTGVPSAQVKSACLFAGLLAEGSTSVREAVPTRDHTERMLRRMGVSVVERSGGLWLTPPDRMVATGFSVPGDPSSAAFFAAAAALVPGSTVSIRGVGLNPRRLGFFGVLRRMGARVEVEWTTPEAADVEPVGDLTVSWGGLAGTDIAPAEVADLVDELPLFACLAAVAEGPSVVAGAGELRIKESDRIAATGDLLRALGADVVDTDDGWRIAGGARLVGAPVAVRGDHRLALCAAVLARCAVKGIVTVDTPQVTTVSFPGFLEALERLG